jgi:hypothetical protein
MTVPLPVSARFTRLPQISSQTSLASGVACAPLVIVTIVAERERRFRLAGC